ncbi:MAG: amino acid-binding protein [Halopenitus sp.]
MSDVEAGESDGVSTDEHSSSTDECATDGGHSTAPSSHTIRLELVDEPGQLLAALQPIADNGGNLLSIYHERGNLTPRGHIPVEVDVEATEERFDAIVEALREEGINVMQAGTDRYVEELTLLLVGHIIDTDFSDTLQRIEECASASVDDVSLTAPRGTEEVSSARLRLAIREGESAAACAAVRSVAEEKGIDVIEPLTGVEA